MNQKEYIKSFLEDCSNIAMQIDKVEIEELSSMIYQLKTSKGRLFILGIGGSAANASHAVNDFRKISNIEAYAPTDNIAEFSARANDDGWSSVFSNWLRGSRLSPKDALLILSVGGGDREKGVSANIVEAIDYANMIGATILGIVGRDGGYTAKNADACVIVPPLNKDTLTPHTEAFQAIIWHLLVTSPLLKENQTKWEGIANGGKL